MLLSSYNGLSTALIRSLTEAAALDLDQPLDRLTQADFDRLYAIWQHWLQRLNNNQFEPGWTKTGYTVLGWDAIAPADDIHRLLQDYYSQELNTQQFSRLKNQLQQKLAGLLTKLRQKEAKFCQRLGQSDQAGLYRRQADLLMAYSVQWQPGMTRLTLTDFETGEPVMINLDPDKSAIQQAQKLYKQHQKLKRARHAVDPLLAEVRQEIAYLEQVEAALTQIDRYQQEADLEAILDIRRELVQQDYLPKTDYRPNDHHHEDEANFHRWQTPSGHPVLVGRNNRQNDLLISKVANDYDLWFHTQEIPGSHVLLRLDPGAVASDQDLQYVADLAAYFSRARQADQVPVIYTAPRHVYKPRGARPGMVIYKHETVIWGQPRRIELALSADRPTAPAIQ